MGEQPREVGPGAAALVTLLAFFWGGNPVAIKLALPDAPPIRQAWMRFALGSLTVLAWARATRRSFWLSRMEIRPLVILGLLFTVQIALQNLGVKYTSAGHVSVLLNSYPLYTMVFAHFFVPGDRLSGWRAAGVVVAYSGVVLLFSGELRAEGASVLGDLLTSASALLLGARQIYTNRTVQRIDPVKLLLAQAAVSIPVYLLWSGLFEPETTRWTLRLAACLAFQGVIVAGFNFIVNTHLLKVYRPSGLSAFYLTTPLFGVLQSWLLVGEPLTLRLLSSAALVVGGIALASRRSGC
jgi:drug/metabolite transporter (DMT)-like permease